MPSQRKIHSMKIPANALVLIADGRKAIILRNAGDEKFPNLKTEWTVVDQNPTTAAQGTDRPGRVNSQGRRSSVEQTDWHNEEEAAFTRRAAAALNELACDAKSRHIVVVAPPRALAVLRRSISDHASRKLIGELPHDLVNFSVADIEAYLDRAEAAS